MPETRRDPARSAWRSMLRDAGALLAASHPEPSLAVTIAACALAVAAGLGARTALVALAVGSGQLSIGWSNDWLDHRRDIATGRSDKPLAQGRLRVRTVARAAWAAAAVCVIASLALGFASAAVHLVAVACGWFYNVRAKHHAYSVVPWAVAFGLLPAVVTLAEPLHRWPAWWVMVAGAALGAGAHFANAIPDLADDRATGVNGLPHRLGRRGSLISTAVLITAGQLLVIRAIESPVLRVALAGVFLLLVTTVVLAIVAKRDRLAFRIIVVLLLLLTVGVLLGGAV